MAQYKGEHMAISHYALRYESARYARTTRSLDEALGKGSTTAFLCHSHKDQGLVLGLEATLRNAGWNVYIDWQDTTMPDTPDQITAAKIQEKIRRLDYFLFLATDNSMASRWCPWEIGYADGVKSLERILIIPTTDAGKNYGNEYLSLYRQIDNDYRGELIAKYPNKSFGTSLDGLGR